MSVLTVLTPEDRNRSMVLWGDRLASARGVELVLLVLQPGPQPTEPKEVDPEAPGEDSVIAEVAEAVLSLTTRPKLLAIRHPEPSVAVLEQVAAVEAELLVLGKSQESLKAIKQGDDWRRRLHRRAPCDTMLLRPGPESGASCTTLLVPVAGGPPGEIALKLAEGMAARRVEGQ